MSYKIRNRPEIVKIIEVPDVRKLGEEGGFLVIQLDTSDEDVIEDLIEEIGIREIACPVIVISNEVSVHEVIQQEEENDKK